MEAVNRVTTMEGVSCSNYWGSNWSL